MTISDRNLLEGLSCLVLAHERAQQVSLLVNQVATHGARCFVHFDARAGVLLDELMPIVPPGTWLAPQSVSYQANWGGFGMIKASLLLLRQALRDPKTRHVCLLSGNHLPIQPPQAIKDFLFNGLQHMDLRLAAAEPPDRESLRRFWYRRLEGREESLWLVRIVNRHTWRFGKRNIARGLRGMTPMVGRQWWHMTAECGHKIINFIDRNPWYEDFFRRVHIPDEAFFQTLVGAFCSDNDIGEPPSWERMNGYSAAVLDATDIPVAQASGRPFARKFDILGNLDAVNIALHGNVA